MRRGPQRTVEFALIYTSLAARPAPPLQWPVFRPVRGIRTSLNTPGKFQECYDAAAYPLWMGQPDQQSPAKFRGGGACEQFYSP
jgi:hypothetical protein